MELRLAMRTGIVVFTDFACWMPIIIWGILAQCKVTTVSPKVYAWIVAFFLPINSAVNPYLYAIGLIVANRLNKLPHRYSPLVKTTLLKRSSTKKSPNAQPQQQIVVFKRSGDSIHAQSRDIEHEIEL